MIDQCTYTNSKAIAFTTNILRSSLCNCIDSYIVATGTINYTVIDVVVFKNNSPSNNYITEINK